MGAVSATCRLHSGDVARCILPDIGSFPKIRGPSLGAAHKKEGTIFGCHDGPSPLLERPMNLNRLGHAFGGFGGRDVQASNPTLFRVYGFRVQKFSVYPGFVG